jgi:hypothetical protein
MAIWHMRFTCWVTKATKAQSEYVILITFPQQQCLHEFASLLCYFYIAVLFLYKPVAPTALSSAA